MLADEIGPIEYIECVTWFVEQLNVKSMRKVAEDMGINVSVVSRQVKRLRPKKPAEPKPLTKSFVQLVATILREEKVKELREQQRADQAAAAELARIKREEDAAQKEKEREEDEEAARQEQERQRKEKLARQERQRQRKEKLDRQEKERQRQEQVALLEDERKMKAAVAEWRTLTAAAGHLASGKLPAFVHPETAFAFGRLIEFEKTSDYKFKNSRLGPDAQDRLKSAQKRTTVPAIGLTVAEMLLGAVKWFCSDGWKWLLGLIAVVVTLVTAWGIWELLKLGWMALQALGSWSKSNWEYYILAAEVLAIGGGITWWVWPKKRDTGWTVAGRLCLVVLAIIGMGIVVAMFIMMGQAIEEIVVATQSLRQGIYVP